MDRKHVLTYDIVNNHNERIHNLKRYYPFFKLQETALSQFREGRYGDLDMGYITLAVLRFFMEENHFNDRDVTYGMYASFMESLLLRDFALELENEESRELVQYIFDKLCNEGRPFIFQYFDPQSHQKRTEYIRFIDSKLSDNELCYFLTSDATAFYLDTKEVKDESGLTVEQVLLEKMIRTQNFKGGLEVIQRINSQVSRLIRRKDEIIKLMSHNIFDGIQALNNFSKEGLSWFEEEQRLFDANRTLVEKALKKAESLRAENAQEQSHTLQEIHQIQYELNRAINKHSALLAASMELQVQADQLLAKSKHNRFRSSFDFIDILNYMIKNDSLKSLESLVTPLLGLNIRKTLNIHQIEDLLTYQLAEQEKGEKIQRGPEENYVYEDEIVESRIHNNFEYMLKVLFDMFKSKSQFDTGYMNYIFRLKFGDEIFSNGDYYAFLAHLSQKKIYDLEKVCDEQDTFLEGIMADFLKKSEYEVYKKLKFRLDFSQSGESYKLTENDFYVTGMEFERMENDG